MWYLSRLIVLGHALMWVACGVGSKPSARSISATPPPSQARSSTAPEPAKPEPAPLKAQPEAVPKTPSVTPPKGARIREIHPLSIELEDCVEMYSFCTEDKPPKCSSAPLSVSCGDYAKVPKSDEWLACKCP